MQETSKTTQDARRFVEALQTNKELRQKAFSVPRQHLLALAREQGYEVTGPDLHDAMREQWASAKVPHSKNVDPEDDPDTCCACTFSESPDL